MLCRALVTAIAISYLLCVLWLSGIQKEDLDVSMLSKLHTSGVNIDDMKKGSLRQECFKPKFSETKNTEEYYPRTAITQIVKRNVKENIVSNLATILNGLVDIQVEVKKIQSDYVPVKNTDALPSTSMTTVSIINVATQETRPAELDKILKFWKMLSTTQVPRYLIESTTKKPENLVNVTKDEQLVIKIDNDKKQQYEPKYMTDMLADDVYYNQNLTSQIPHHYPLVDVNKLSQIIRFFLKFYPQGNLTRLHEIFNETSLANHMLSENHTITKENIQEKPKLYSDIAKRYNNHTIRMQKKNFTNVKGIPDFRNSEYFHQSYVTPLINMNFPVDIPNKDKNVYTNENLNKLTKNVTKDFAKIVKTLVLKELRQELVTTSTLVNINTASVNDNSNTAPTTPRLFKYTAEATTSDIRSKVNKTQDAMEKIIKILEELKDMKEKEINSSKKAVEVTEKAIEWPVYNNFVKIDNHPPILVDRPGVLNPRVNTGVIYLPFRNHSIPSKPSNQAISRANIVEGSNLHAHQKGLHLIIQTNSGEIPPLGVRLSKPFNIIHQNIIVATNRPKNTAKQKTRWNDAQKYINKKSTTPNFLESSRLFDQNFYNERSETPDRQPHSAETKKINIYRYAPTGFKYDKPTNSSTSPYKSARNQDGNFLPLFKHKNQKPRENRFHKNTRFDNQEDEYRLQRFDNGKPRSLEQSVYKYLKYENRDDINNQAQIQNDKTIPKKIEHKPYRNENVKIQKVNRYSPLENVNSKVLAQGFYAKIGNQKESHSLARFDGKKPKSFNQSLMKRIPEVSHPNTNDCEGSRCKEDRLPRFGSDKLESLERYYSKSIHNEYDKSPISFNNNKPISPEQRLYDRVRNEDYRPSRFQDILGSEPNNYYFDKTKDTKHYQKDKINYGTFRNADRERFYEKLERVDNLNADEDYKKRMEETCEKMNLAKRQQESLNSVKKSSNYDDIHFRQFLRTQQKVNEMLEKLLATKVDLHSNVETI